MPMTERRKPKTKNVSRFSSTDDKTYSTQESFEETKIGKMELIPIYEERLIGLISQQTAVCVDDEDFFETDKQPSMGLSSNSKLKTQLKMFSEHITQTQIKSNVLEHVTHTQLKTQILWIFELSYILLLSKNWCNFGTQLF